MNIDITAYLIPAALSIGVIVAYLGSYFKGTSSVSKEVINTYEIQVKQLKELRMEDTQKAKEQFELFTTQVNNLTLQIGKQSGVIEEKEKQILKLEQILQNRNPELITVLEEIKRFMKDLHDKTGVIAERTERAEKRDLAVDQGHASVAV